MTYKGFNIKQVSWDSVRSKIKPFNSLLVDIIDRISPPSNYKLFITKYEYGDKILKRGIFQLPDDKGNLIPISSQIIPRDLRNAFQYSGYTNPVFVVLKRQLELYVDLHSRIVPFLMIKPGNMFGVWKVLSQLYTDQVSHAPFNVWDMSCGARSIFMLPKISENLSHDRLQRKYNFSHDKPKNFRDQWDIFTRLYKSPRFHKKWASEILLFSVEWFESLSDPAWNELRLYLLDFNWKCSEYWRNQFIWRMTFSQIHNMLHINPSQHYVDIVNHLFAIGVGALPGFEPAMNDELAPVSRIQEIYINDYGIKWPPILMQPANFDINSNNASVYYSLQYPSSLELSPKSSKKSSIVNDAYMVCSLLEKYVRELSHGNFGIDELPLSQLSEKVNFSFYHQDNDDYPKLQPSEEIKNDSRFSRLIKRLGYNEIPINSAFCKGCIKLSVDK